jgi:hypothetical protein
MPAPGTLPRTSGAFAAFFAAAFLFAADGTALAGNTANKLRAVTAPRVSLESDSSALSPAALGESDHDKSATGKADGKFPDSIKFGDHTLRFDTDRKSIDSIPRVGLDAKDPAILPTQKDQDLPPSYFGLTLTVPTR